MLSIAVLVNSISTGANQVPKQKLTDTKLYVSVVALSTQDNVKLLKQLESSFKKTLNWNKYQSKRKKISRKTDIYIF